VPGTLRVITRSRSTDNSNDAAAEPVEESLEWKVSETAIVICDMWDDHWCVSASQRVKVMAPRMNDVISVARGHGVQIIHAPSDTMNYYKDMPFRRRMQQAATAEPPGPIQPWRKLDPKREPPLPIDDAAGGCDDPNPLAPHQAWTRQHPAIDIVGADGITDSGVEVFNYCRQEGIKNIVVMGVHTNMCVLGRSFGIRQLTELGFNVVLARDLTDSLYDPRQKPHVSHNRGTELMVEHIEKYWCPSIDSADLTKIIPGSADAGALE
jgi:nicotinamidase-related amidase